MPYGKVWKVPYVEIGTKAHLMDRKVDCLIFENNT
jgi:hypothetical protein